MNARVLTVGSGRRALVAELGERAPVLYLHDIFDVHGSTRDWLPFHRALAANARIVAPAHAGCADSDEDEDAETSDDVVFHVLETLDALGIARIPVIGTGIGGWTAAELAVRHPDVVERLALLGATGLFVRGEPIGDMFFAAQPLDGGNFRDLRELFFADADGTLAREHIPDGRMELDREMLRYRTYRFANRLGFRPPYLYHHRLRERLPRYRNPVLILWGTDDRLVPVAHARAYAEGFPDAQLELIAGAGHSIHLERPSDVAAKLTAFLTRAPLSSRA